MARIAKGIIPQKSIGNYKKSELPKSSISFSFKFLDNAHSEFNLKKVNIKYINALFERFKNVSTMDISQFRGDGNQGNAKAMRSHLIDWDETPYKAGFSHLPEQYKEYEPRQFSISLSNGRIHGFLMDHVFCVVWFDPDHMVYPSKK